MPVVALPHSLSHLQDPFRKNLRRTVMRYLNLSTILVYRLVSLKVKERFPSYNEMVAAKLILPHEVERLKTADARTPHESTFTPILWAVKLLQRARTEGKITVEAPIFANLIASMDYIEECNRKILNYGWVNFPLAYTQVATVSVFCYFLAALFGRQFLIPRDEYVTKAFPHLSVNYSNKSPFNAHTPDFYVPFFTYVELLSYMGWIKVAETLLNPFGDDDEDFQVNYMIDRNLQVSYLIVDEAEEVLEMAEDPFLEAGIMIPKDLPAYKNKSHKAFAAGDRVDTVADAVSPVLKRGNSRTPAIFNRLRDSIRSRAKNSTDANRPGNSNSLGAMRRDRRHSHYEGLEESEDDEARNRRKTRDHATELQPGDHHQGRPGPADETLYMTAVPVEPHLQAAAPDPSQAPPPPGDPAEEVAADISITVPTINSKL